MVDLAANAALARGNGFNLTGRLRHAVVKQLAVDWIPHIFFHERERFHPIALERLFSAPPAVMAALPQAARDALRIAVLGPSGINRFNPPVVRQGSNVLGSGATASRGLDDPPISDGSTYTHGGNLHASRQFFGASDTIAGVPEPTAGDPRAPRHPIAVIAEMRFLLETLKHELQARKPADALWGRFDVVNLLFQMTLPPALPFSGSLKRAVLAALIDAHQRQDTTAQEAALARIPQGWQLSERAWKAVTQFAFLEYYFVYAFNDFSEYATFGNEHELDVEGCCVVFDRLALDRLADGDTTRDKIVAHTVITLVHKEWQNADELKRLPEDRSSARRELEVFVAPGSHATYLSKGDHDFLGPNDVVGAVPAWVWLALLVVPGGSLLLSLLLLLAVAEHFVGPEDHTTDDGVSIGPGPTPAPGGPAFGKRLIVTPLSDIDGDANLYQAALAGKSPPDGLRLVDLARRAFPGQWGGTNGLIDQSDPWENATARYFRKFLRCGDVPTPIIT